MTFLNLFNILSTMTYLRCYCARFDSLQYSSCLASLQLKISCMNILNEYSWEETALQLEFNLALDHSRFVYTLSYSANLHVSVL